MKVSRGDVEQGAWLGIAVTVVSFTSGQMYAHGLQVGLVFLALPLMFYCWVMVNAWRAEVNTRIVTPVSPETISVLCGICGQRVNLAKSGDNGGIVTVTIAGMQNESKSGCCECGTNVILHCTKIDL